MGRTGKSETDNPHPGRVPAEQDMESKHQERRKSNSGREQISSLIEMLGAGR